MEIIVGRQGNQKIAILDNTVSRQHCKLTEQADGSFVLENLSQNGTFVNGQSVIKSHVTRNTVLQLGPTYKVKVADLVDAKEPVSPHQAETPKPASTPDSPTAQPKEIPSFSIRPMQRVWDEYQNSLEEIKQKQKSIQNLRTVSPIFTMGSGALSGIANSCGWGNAVVGLTMVLTVIGVIVSIYAFVKASSDNSDELRKEATDKFQEHYVCPNPKCQHTHAQAPKLLLQNKTCPYCKCKYTE